MRPFKTAVAVLLAVVGAGVVLLSAGTASASAYTVKIGGPLDLGTVIAGLTGDTTFHIDPASGAVTVLSGSGRRVTATAVRALVTISCKPSRGGDLTCDTDNVNVVVATIGSLTGRARAFPNFAVSMSTATLLTGPTGTNSVAFTIAPIGTNGSKTFFIGGDFPIAGDNSALASGNATNGFSAAVMNPSGATLAADSNQGKAKVFRALTIAKASDLNFGRVQRPTAGSGTVTLNASTGVRTVTGTGTVAFSTPTPTIASFTVSGEGGQAFSGSIPTSLVLDGPTGSTLTVTITKTLPASPTLSGSLGTGGTKSFNVGGSFPISAGMVVGTYSGVLTVTLDYN